MLEKKKNYIAHKYEKCKSCSNSYHLKKHFVDHLYIIHFIYIHVCHLTKMESYHAYYLHPVCFFF